MSMPEWRKESHPFFVNWYPVHILSKKKDESVFTVFPPKEESDKLLEWYREESMLDRSINPGYPDWTPDMDTPF